MGSWLNENGLQFWSILNPALWSATRQSFAARVNESLKFLKSVKSDFLKGESDQQVAQEKDGGFILQIVGSTPNGRTDYYRVLADKDDYFGTIANSGFLNRYVTVTGAVVFGSNPTIALPGGSTPGLLKANLLGGEGGAVKPVFGTWYTGAGALRPVDGSVTEVYQKSGSYGGDDDLFDLAFYAGAEDSQDEGRLMLFENAAHGCAFQLTFFFGPRCEQS